jgi:tetratricopeptide (TPR) repeat protein
VVEVPSELLQNGKNRVDFSYAGRGKYSYAVALSGWTDDFPEEKPWGKPYPTNRRIYHAPLRYKGRPMGSSTQEVGQIQVGEVVRVSVWFENGQSWRPFVIREPLPAGCALVPDSLQANQEHVEMRDGEMLITFKPNTQMHSFSYELVGAVPGTYKIAPTQMSDALDPSLVVCAERSNLEVLAPGESADYTYKMNCSEMWSFAEAYFNDNAFEESLDYLEQLKKECPGGYVPSKERLLVWILSRPEFYDADALVDAFEVLKEKQPDLWVPFEKMQMVGRAYRDKGEHERAALVLKATIEASFYRDSRGGGTLENEGRYLASWDYMDRLIAEYPNLNPVIDAEFGLTQLVYNRAQDPESLWDEIKTKAKPDEEYHLPNRIDILGWAVDRLREFRCMHPESPLGDDAAFSEASALLEIGQHERMVELVRLGRKIYPKDANYAEQFPYMEALGLFHQRAFDEAVQAAEEVAGSRNENRDLAVYILGQIYHAQEKPAEAVRYYERVAGQFPDAAGALEYFKREELSLPEITILKPGEEVKLEVTSRNLKDARVLVYRVDLMTLYLREKNLARIAQVNLAGIDPQVGLDLELAEAVDYAEHKHEVALPLEEDGAFLVLVRSGDRFASGLVLVTPLSIEVQEDAVSGTVRVNVRDTEGYAEDVHVKAVGSAEGQVRSGDTDLRGVVVIDGIRGNATIIARDKDRHYAFHRGEKWLGPRGEPRDQAEAAGIAVGQEIDLASNLRKQVQMQVESNLGQQQNLYSNTIKGVQVQAAF